MKLSVLMASYNEEQWLESIVNKVLKQHVPGISSREIVIVDDCSTDGTKKIIESLTAKHAGTVVPVYHSKNQGKGASLRSAIEKMSGDLCIVQDADLEYDPADYPLVLEPIISGRADVVYGSR